MHWKKVLAAATAAIAFAAIGGAAFALYQASAFDASVARDYGIAPLGKILDRLDALPLDVARRIDHTERRPKTLPAQPTAAYGEKLARSCVGCHGQYFSGGPIPGAPSDLPIPANLTPHESGLAAITEADWNRILDTGIKRSGVPLNSFMPIGALRAMNAAERGALYRFLRALPARPFGQR